MNARVRAREDFLNSYVLHFTSQFSRDCMASEKTALSSCELLRSVSVNSLDIADIQDRATVVSSQTKPPDAKYSCPTQLTGNINIA